MYYKSIELQNYRNYKERHFEFHEKVNFFIGPNAAGKTNLLESLYLTAYGKSFRTTKDRQLILFGEDICRVRGVFLREYTGEEEHTIDISLSREGDRRGKVDGIDLKKYSDIFDHVLAVVFSPEDLKIIKESPDRRREFMDREIGALSLAYYRNALMYSRVLAQRNAYLKEETRDAGLLSVWDESLIHYGGAMVLQRYLFIEKLQRLCAKIHSDLTGSRERIRLVYDTDVGTESIRAWEKEIEASEESNAEKKPSKEQEKTLLENIRAEMKEVFEASADHDLRLRYTTRGPQKDDIEVYLAKEGETEVSARQFASQGQQRTAALSLKLSEIALIREERGEAPILLLDDVLSELDLDRQNYLIHALDDVQLFITATELPEALAEQLPDGRTIHI